MGQKELIMASSRPTPKMDFHGTNQTCYSDWSHCVLSFYPFNPKYQRNNNIIAVFSDNQKIAEFDFDTGTGYVVSSKVYNLEEVGKLPNFEEFDLDTLLYIE